MLEAITCTHSTWQESHINVKLDAIVIYYFIFDAHYQIDMSFISYSPGMQRMEIRDSQRVNESIFVINFYFRLYPIFIQKKRY